MKYLNNMNDNMRLPEQTLYSKNSRGTYGRTDGWLDGWMAQLTVRKYMQMDSIVQKEQMCSCISGNLKITKARKNNKLKMYILEICQHYKFNT